MLARIDAALHDIPGEQDVFRVEGNQFAVPVGELSEAASIAERGRSVVESLAIPLQHPQIETYAVVTVSAAVVPIAGSSLEERSKAALYEAKDRGRNRVFVGAT